MHMGIYVHSSPNILRNCILRIILFGLLLASPRLVAAQEPTALKPLAKIPATEKQTQNFKKEIAPLLQSRCVSCHNEINKKGKLSLQTRSAMLASEVVVPGDSDSSYLLDLLAPEDGKAEMPKGAPPLSQAERTALKEWIDDGAVWPEDYRIERPVWWSLQPLTRPNLPELASGQGIKIRNPIDRFVRATHADKSLTPNKEAGRAALIRRVYYDLLGMPPTPAAIQAFVDDPSENAYEQLVDELLKSPHYGERWARHWLDVVKYADTCGYDKDKLRPNAWPYRDYVIRSFNDDKPYTRFVQEQIAGDALFPGTSDGIVGLGFIAAGPWDFIGHVEVPDTKIDGKVARNIDRDEMVTNTFNTFNSVTVQCARCHDHKFDPITQTHYYRLQSIFAAVDRADRQYDSDPETESKRTTLKQQLAETNTKKTLLLEQIKKEAGPLLAVLDKKIADLKTKTGPRAKNPAFGFHSNISLKQDATKWVQVDLGSIQRIARVELHPCHDEYKNIGAGFGFPVRFRIEASNSEKFDEGVRILANLTDRDLPNPGLSAYAVNVEDFDAQFIRVTATKLGPRGGDFILALAELRAFGNESGNIARGTKVTSYDSIQAPVRWARKNLTDGIWVTAADPKAAKQLAETQKQRGELLAKIETKERLAAIASFDKTIADTQQSIAKLPAGQMVYAAASKFKPQGNFKPTGGKPRMIHVLHRGNVQEPREEVRPGPLPIFNNEQDLFQLDTNHSEADRRVALAKWMTRKDHPLTWRSIVNRVWHYHFGRGIVDSPNDFGRMGGEPTHPQLLDWLAVEFRDNGQSFKKLHRLIVTSSTYRLAAGSNQANNKIDSGNQYLWRSNRRRLEAEEIRDSILLLSGKLNTKMYGKGFFLFALEKTAHSPHYEYHKHDPNDPASHRRSIYRFIARSQPDPYMTTLDCADSSQSTPARNETLTSLQALALLNNKFNLAMAEHFAKRLETSADDLESRVAMGFEMAAGRKATAGEADALTKYAAKHGLPNLCRLLFNLSEFVYVD